MQSTVCFWLIVDILMQTKRQILLHLQSYCNQANQFCSFREILFIYRKSSSYCWKEAASLKLYMSCHQIAITKMLLWIISGKISRKYHPSSSYLSSLRAKLLIVARCVFISSIYLWPEWFCELPLVFMNNDLRSFLINIILECKLILMIPVILQALWWKYFLFQCFDYMFWDLRFNDSCIWFSGNMKKSLEFFKIWGNILWWWMVRLDPFISHQWLEKCQLLNKNSSI